MLFLIDYDRNASRISSMQAFEDAQRGEAYEARFRLESVRDRERNNHEVVLLEAASEDVIRTTHRRYFAKDLAELATLPATAATKGNSTTPRRNSA